MNKFGVHYAYWTNTWERDYVYYIKKAAQIGFDVLEIVTDHLIDEPLSGLDRLAKTAEDNGIELTCCIGISRDRDLSSPDSAIRERGIEFVKRSLEVTHTLRSKIFTGVNYAAWQPEMPANLEDKRPYVDRSVDSIRQVIGIAENYGILYCAEIVNRYEQFIMNTVEEGKNFIRQVDSPNMKLLLDAFHMNIEEDHIGESIIAAGKDIGHFHIGECNRKVPGKGHMPWIEITDSLKKIQYSGMIVMEPFIRMGGEVASDIKVWRDLSRGADEGQMDTELTESLKFMRRLL